jgi:hypothetical protein
MLLSAVLRTVLLFPESTIDVAYDTNRSQLGLRYWVEPKEYENNGYRTSGLFVASVEVHPTFLRRRGPW